MAIKYLNNLDLNKNQLQQAVIQTASSDPSSPVAGQIYYNTTDNVLKFYNGSAFVSAGGDLTAITSATTNQLTIANNTGPIPALTIVTGAVANAGTALATGDQIYDFVTTGINARIQNVTDPTGAQDVATKAYVDTVATGMLEYKGAYNASTNSPALTGGSCIASGKGDTYTVTADGSFLGEQVRVGDLIIVEVAIAASSTPALADFTIVQSNVDLATAAATSGAAVKGISGYDSNNFSVSGGFVSLKKFSASIGDGSNTSYTVNHALGSRDVIVQLFDNSSYDTVIADVVRTDVNNVTISFTVAPSTNDIRVLIQKI
tara:strand:- start:168 stop:1121 length:954 start_codon:yes stop_codon:yes gene_type:complete